MLGGLGDFVPQTQVSRPKSPDPSPQNQASGGLRPPEAEAFLADKVVIKAFMVHILSQHFNQKTWFESMLAFI